MINAMVIPCFEKARERAQIIDDDIAALDDDELKEVGVMLNGDGSFGIYVIWAPIG